MKAGVLQGAILAPFFFFYISSGPLLTTSHANTSLQCQISCKISLHDLMNVERKETKVVYILFEALRQIVRLSIYLLYTTFLPLHFLLIF